MNTPVKNLYLVNILLSVSLLATLVFMILSCFLAAIVFPWLALSFGVATLVLGFVSYFEW